MDRGRKITELDPAKWPRLAIPLAGSSTTSPATQGQSCTLCTVCTVCTVRTACTACTCQTHPPPPQLPCRYAPPPLRPHQHSPGLGLEDSTSRLPVRKLRSNGYSMLPPALHMFGPDGSSRTPALYVVNSRELHGMLPRSTRDKAGGRRTRHCSEWRGEGREVDGEGEGGEEGKEGQGQQRDHPQSPELQPCSGHKVLTQHQR